MNDLSSECFSESYAEARPKFCSAAAAGRRRAPLLAQSRRRAVPTARVLYLDTARFGPADAENMLVLIAGTHGVEGHCGSGAEIAWLRIGGPAKLPQGYRRAADPRPQSLRLRLDAPRHRGQCRSQPQLRRPRQGLSAQRRLSRHRRRRAAAGAGTRRARPRPSACSRPMPRSTAPSACRARSAAASTAIPTASSSAATRRPGATAPSAPSPARSCRGPGASAIIDFHTGLGPFGHGELICAVSPGRQVVRRAPRPGTATR